MKSWDAVNKVFWALHRMRWPQVLNDIVEDQTTNAQGGEHEEMEMDASVAGDTPALP
jgi:hypothetical protein